MRPITALRVMAAAMMILLIAALFVPKAKDFLIGVALGLSVGVVVTVWNNQLKWQDECDRGELTELQLGGQR